MIIRSICVRRGGANDHSAAIVRFLRGPGEGHYGAHMPEVQYRVISRSVILISWA